VDASTDDVGRRDVDAKQDGSTSSTRTRAPMALGVGTWIKAENHNAWSTGRRGGWERHDAIGRSEGRCKQHGRKMLLRLTSGSHRYTSGGIGGPLGRWAELKPRKFACSLKL
jgi:hypothetical protein